MPSVSVPAIEIFLEPDEVGSKFARLFEDRDTTDLHQDIGEHLINSTDERFVAQKAPDGAPWAPLSPATLVSGYRKKRKGNKPFKRSRGGGSEQTAGFSRYVANKKILQEQGIRGGLRGSINYRADDGSVVLGANKVYAAAQHFGLGERSSVSITKRGSTPGRGFGKLPARPFVGVSDEDERVIADIVRRWIADQVMG